MIGPTKFDIEHALGVYAYSYVNLPAEYIYDDNALGEYAELVETCHIYFIGYRPKIFVSGFRQADRRIFVDLKVLKEERVLVWDFPCDIELKEVDGYWFVQRPDGKRFAPSEAQLIDTMVEQYGRMEFDVRYIGQAFGKNGERSSLDRLKKHETLQRIALNRAPEGYQIELLLIAVQPSNQIMTSIVPNAIVQDKTGERIQAGLDKLFGTDERERVAIYEAAMIKYFQPEFNKDYKDSFPSDRLKILQDCYVKDMSSVSAEFCFDQIPYQLCSDAVKPSTYHIAFYNLHSEEERKAFFCM